MNALGVQFDLVGKHAVVAGLPWSFSFTYRAGAAKAPVDLTGCSARLVIFDSVSETSTPIESNVSLGGAAGTFELDLDEAITAQVAAFEQPRFRLYLTNSLGRERLFMRGRLAVVDEE